MSENYRVRGSNIGPSGSALGTGVVVSSKVVAPAVAVAGAAGVAEVAHLIYQGTSTNVPHIISSLPGVGHPITSVLVDMGNAIHGVEGSALGHVAIAGGAAFVGYKAYRKIGKPMQESLKRVSRHHGLE